MPSFPGGPQNLLQSSNYWFPSPVHTAVRGITIYDGEITGIIIATLRIAQPGGANIATYQFQIRGGSNSESFNAWLGSQQNGSAFVPLDIDLPAGALVGIDFQLMNPTSEDHYIDFVGYVWIDQRTTPFSPPADY